MYKIGIIGHSIEDFSNFEEVSKKIVSTIDILKYQYSQDTVINIAYNTGVGQYVADSCLDMDVKYNLNLPFTQSLFSEVWYKTQCDKLAEHVKSSYGISVSSSTLRKDGFTAASKKIVDESNFIVFFWAGKHQGITYEALKYALKNNKLALDGLKDLRLITSNMIFKGER